MRSIAGGLAVVVVAVVVVLQLAGRSSAGYAGGRTEHQVAEPILYYSRRSSGSSSGDVSSVPGPDFWANRGKKSATEGGGHMVFLPAAVVIDRKRPIKTPGEEYSPLEFLAGRG